MVKWIQTIATTLLLGFIAYIAAGVMEAKTFEIRIYKLEGISTKLDSDISNFKSDIKHDIGVIKGQNDIIIKLLKEEKR